MFTFDAKSGRLSGAWFASTNIDRCVQSITPSLYGPHLDLPSIPRTDDQPLNIDDQPCIKYKKNSSKERMNCRDQTERMSHHISTTIRTLVHIDVHVGRTTQILPLRL